jgi:periplasmic divalent cation tolerance protein
MAKDVLVVFCSFPDPESAKRIVRDLVDQRVIACGNLFNQVESIYRWEGERKSTTEVFGILKTTAEAYPKLEALLKAQHSYEVPEIVAVPASAGLPSYFAWVRESVSGA